MSDDGKFVYIQNVHGKPITCNIRDSSGRVIATKKFMPTLTEKFSGKVLHTGYEKLTKEEYEALLETSRTFKVYSGRTGIAKLLVVHNELPADAKTPHEALADARKGEQKAKAEITKLKGEITSLKAELLDAQNKYNQLSSASSDEEKLELLNDKIAKLEGQLEEGAKLFEEKIAELQKLVDENRALEDKAVELQAALNKLDEISEVFASKTLELAGRDEHVRALVDAFRAERKDLLTLEESKDSDEESKDSE